MAVVNIGNWNNLTSTLITNYYLYGTAETPENYDDRLRSKYETITLKIDAVSFMQIDAPGSYAYAARAKGIEKFFSSTTLQNRTYSYAEIKNLLNLKDSEFSFIIQQKKIDTSSDNYAQRTFTFNTNKFEISDLNDLVFEVNGSNKVIHNIKVVPSSSFQDNFDFDGGEGTNLGNSGLEYLIDPYKIGSKVNIDYYGHENISKISYNSTMFENQINLIGTKDSILWEDNAIFKLYGVINSLEDNNIIKYETDTGGRIIYGNNNNNSLGGSIYGDALIGGAGNDTLVGFEGNDFLYGGLNDDNLHGNTGDDTLKGGTGRDILTGGEGDDILYGGADNDTYIFSHGDGQDVITDNGGIIKIGDNIIAGKFIGSSTSHYDKTIDGTLYQVHISNGNLVIVNNHNINDTITIIDGYTNRKGWGIDLHDSGSGGTPGGGTGGGTPGSGTGGSGGSGGSTGGTTPGMGPDGNIPEEDNDWTGKIDAANDNYFTLKIAA